MTTLDLIEIAVCAGGVLVSEWAVYTLGLKRGEIRGRAAAEQARQREEFVRWVAQRWSSGELFAGGGPRICGKCMAQDDSPDPNPKVWGVEGECTRHEASEPIGDCGA
jgi:hypothetical protein